MTHSDQQSTFTFIISYDVCKIPLKNTEQTLILSPISRSDTEIQR